MSFEGYYQVICKNGHHSHTDLNFSTDDWECPDCEAKCAWWNLVDITNGSYEGMETSGKRIDGFIEPRVKDKAKTCTCKECGNIHATTIQTYHIPKNKGHKVK